MFKIKLNDQTIIECATMDEAATHFKPNTVLTHRNSIFDRDDENCVCMYASCFSIARSDTKSSC